MQQPEPLARLNRDHTQKPPLQQPSSQVNSPLRVSKAGGTLQSGAFRPISISTRSCRRSTPSFPKRCKPPIALFSLATHPEHLSRLNRNSTDAAPPTAIQPSQLTLAGVQSRRHVAKWCFPSIVNFYTILSLLKRRLFSNAAKFQ